MAFYLPTSNPALTQVKELQKLILLSSEILETSKASTYKQQACTLAHKLWLELEEPGHLIDRIRFQAQENAVLRLAVDLGIYELFCHFHRVIECPEVANKTKADIVLIERILRNLASLGHIEETGVGAYKANKFTKAFTTQKGVSIAKFSHDFSGRASNQIPEYFRKNGYTNPVNPLDTPLQQAFGSNKHFFELMVEQDVLQTFHNAMASYQVGRAEFLDIFPAEEQLINGYRNEPDSNAVLLVDVGGGQGKQTLRFRERFPNFKGRMILQDQRDVIQTVTRSEAMEPMVHDFFLPQPVKGECNIHFRGARCYYFRMIFHDWPDDKCMDILKNTVSAMEAGYSKLLINDIVLPDQGASRFATQSDINMMCLLAAMERSESQWRRLLEGAGLKVVNIWKGDPESVIEAVVEAAPVA